MVFWEGIFPNKLGQVGTGAKHKELGRARGMRSSKFYHCSPGESRVIVDGHYEISGGVRAKCRLVLSRLEQCVGILGAWRYYM